MAFLSYRRSYYERHNSITQVIASLTEHAKSMNISMQYVATSGKEMEVRAREVLAGNLYFRSSQTKDSLMMLHNF